MYARIVTLCALGALASPALSQAAMPEHHGEDVSVERLDVDALFQAEAALRRPLEFEPGTAQLLDASSLELADHALTLAVNPDARVILFVSGLDRELAETQEQALRAAFAEYGVAEDQLVFMTTLNTESFGTDRAQITVIAGELAVGAVRVSVEVDAWPGAEVALLPQAYVKKHPDSVCAPPPGPHRVRADIHGKARPRQIEQPVVAIGWDDTKRVLFPHRVGDDPVPVDLASQVHDPVCDDGP